MIKMKLWLCQYMNERIWDKFITLHFLRWKHHFQNIVSWVGIFSSLCDIFSFLGHLRSYCGLVFNQRSINCANHFLVFGDGAFRCRGDLSYFFDVFWIIILNIFNFLVFKVWSKSWPILGSIEMENIKFDKILCFWITFNRLF